MIKRLAHVCLGASDLSAAEDFYIRKLGLSLAFEFFRAGQRIGFYVGVGEHTFIEIFADDELLTERDLASSTSAFKSRI